ncbi:MAG: threonine/serine exporter family protein, partial [Planctomycetota bacterium]
LATTKAIVSSAILERARHDAAVINVAGRQRMLSQKIAKAALRYEHAATVAEVQSAHDELQTAANEWAGSHQDLRFGSEERGIPTPSERWGRGSTLLAFAVASGGAATFFGGSAGDLLAALVVGLLVGLLSILGSRLRRAKRAIEAIAGAFAAAVALVVERLASPALVSAGHGWAAVDAFLVTLSGLIVLLPGLTLTLAMSELANRQLVSGTGRVTHAATILLSVGFGIAVGRTIGGFLPDAVEASEALPSWAVAAALVVSPSAFSVLFRARPKDMAVITLAAVLGFLGARAGSDWFGPAVGASVGALVIGVIANADSRLFDRPAAVASIPGLILLVPGSLGLRSFESLLGDDSVAGVRGVFTTVMVASSLAVGLLLANVVLPARREL